METKGILKTCDQGHQFYKKSDCPTCPICENERKPNDSFLKLIGAPARRALEREHILSLEELAKWTEKEIASLHGMGPSTMPKLRKALNEEGRGFRTEGN
jgi:predicted RecB family nuclease